MTVFVPPLIVSIVTDSIITPNTLALSCTLTLLLLLLQRELTMTARSHFARILNQTLSIGITPLLIAFVFIFISRVFREIIK